ncbi:MAG: site-specific integrase [Ruminococcus sp.]|nr:site-specific integrase [Ruminococcus sp.]
MKNSIYHRKDGRYEGRITIGKKENGLRKFLSFFGRTYDEVTQKMDAVRQNLQPSCVCSKTVSQVFNEWYQGVRYRVKESTAANYMLKAKKHILPVFGEKSVDAIQASDIYDFISSRQSMGLSNRYITDILVLMKSIFKFAVRTYRILNPMDGIMMPKRKNPEIRLLDDAQLQKLEQYIAKNPSKTTMGVALCLTTGLRIGELCALQWEDIDLKKRVLTVRKTIQRIQKPNGKSKTSLIITEPKSESSKRCIPIPECMVNLLKKFMGKSKDYLISGKEKPIEPRTMQYRFAKILKNVNLPSIHFHALRHMFASNCIKLGFDVKALSEILGHSNVEITLNRYVHSSFAQKQAYMSRVQLQI